MTSKDRMRKTMHLGTADRVPVMCQLSYGHYFLYSGVDPLDIWYTTDGVIEALVTLARRYQFDGILVNLPGRDPDYRKYIQSVETVDNGWKIFWKNSGFTDFPRTDNPHYHSSETGNHPIIDSLDVDQLYYIEPWDITGITYPYHWGFEEEPRGFDNFFPDYHLDPLKQMIRNYGNEFSIHSEVFSPWSQFLELLNYEAGLLAIMDQPEKTRECLDRLTEGTIDLALKQAKQGADAILISSAYAGGGFISPQHYQQFVAPYERRIVDAVHKAHPDLPVYTHTCGMIGDRLELILSTGTKGIDTLDPPPLGNVDLEDAKQRLRGSAFIKGNIDPVNTLLKSSPEEVEEDVRWRLEVGKKDGGYILSSACSVAPETPPENLELLTPLASRYGQYSPA